MSSLIGSASSLFVEAPTVKVPSGIANQASATSSSWTTADDFERSCIESPASQSTEAPCTSASHSDEETDDEICHVRQPDEWTPLDNGYGGLALLETDHGRCLFPLLSDEPLPKRARRVVEQPIMSTESTQLRQELEVINSEITSLKKAMHEYDVVAAKAMPDALTRKRRLIIV